jgi:hypothetical protein
VIKPDRGRDEYVTWSTVTESPHGYGNRAEVVGLLRDGIRRHDAEDRANPEAAVDRADGWGSSAFPKWGFGHWDDESFIYQQAGSLPRDCLWRAAVLQCEGRGRDILDLLDPFEDDEGGAWLEERMRRAEEVDAVEN